MERQSNSKYTRLFLCHPCHDCNLMLSDGEYNLLTYLTCSRCILHILDKKVFWEDAILNFFQCIFWGTIFFFEGGISFLGVTFCSELFFVGEIFDINKANYPDSEHPVQFPSYKHLSSIVLCAKTSPSPTGFKNLHFLHKRWNLFLPLQAVKC